MEMSERLEHIRKGELVHALLLSISCGVCLCRRPKENGEEMAAGEEKSASRRARNIHCIGFSVACQRKGIPGKKREVCRDACDL